MGLKKLALVFTLALFSHGLAQTTDVELGVKRLLSDEVTTPYALVRFNYRVGPPIFSSDIYVIPEFGANLSSNTQLWVAGELLIDGPYSSEFIRLEYTEASGIYVKAGARFGFGD